MPKMKTKGAVKKRFKVSKNGKISFKKAGKNHLQSKHNKRHRRRQNKDSVLSKADQKKVKKLLRI
jgi:large subunit ribosomal protein L35